MHKKIGTIKRIIICVIATILLGCSAASKEKIEAEQSLSPVPTLAPTPTERLTPEPTAEEVYIPVCNTDTPERPEVPTQTETPPPSAASETNPFIGVWTIEDFPFSLELRDNQTYLITVSEKEREGTYTFDAKNVLLSGTGDSQIELQYYTNADVLKIGPFNLIRDDLVFGFALEGIPISFQRENEDLSVKVRGAVVTVTAKECRQICSYCFTGAGLTPPENSADWFDVVDSDLTSESICIFKYDGDYTLWTRDEKGTLLKPIDITVDSGFRYTVLSDGIDYLHQSLRRFLRNRESSVDELNRSISRDVAAAGFYTRAGAVTAGVSLISALSKYGYSVGYQQNGVYQAEQDWGVNPNWGAKLGISEDDSEDDEVRSVDSYTGMNSKACIVWAYKQAGLNICVDAETQIGALGECESAFDNRLEVNRGKSGDIIQQGEQYRLVIDRLDRDRDGSDDAYLTFEMGKLLLTTQILSFNKMQGAEVYSMDAFFSGAGRNGGKVKPFHGAAMIPAEELPQYIKDTMDSETTQSSFFELIKKLGF